MKFRRKIFTLFTMAGLAVFLVGRISSPTLPIDKTLVQGVQMRGQLQALRNSLAEKDVSEAEFAEIDKEILTIEERLESILVEARVRHYSRWRTDVIALSIIVLGLIVSLFSSWKSDVHRLTQPNK